MNKALSEQRQVYSFLQKALDQQTQQANALQVMLNRMIEIEQHVDEKFGEITVMVQEVRDSVTLTNQECYELQSAVALKSIQLTKDRYNEEEGDFNKVVGKYRRMIWKQLKNKFNVPRYNCIRRIDFDEAITFVFDFKPEDYL